MNVAALQWRLEGIHNDATCDGDLTAGKIATTSLARILAHFLVILEYPEEAKVEKVLDVCLIFFLFAQSVILHM